MFYTFWKHEKPSLWWRWCFPFSGTHTHISALWCVSSRGRAQCLEADQHDWKTCFCPTIPEWRVVVKCDVINHMPGQLQCSNRSIPCPHLWNSVSFSARRQTVLLPSCYESLRKVWDLECKMYLSEVTDWWPRSSYDPAVWESSVPVLHHHNNAQLPGHPSQKKKPAWLALWLSLCLMW